MHRLEKVIRELKALTSPAFTRDLPVNQQLFYDTIAILEEQEQEIVNLTTKVAELTTSQKARPDCAGANHDTSGCLGYCHAENDDEPIDICKACDSYTGNVEGGKV